MARPLRIEYPDAYYHVSNRSDRKSGLFPGEDYYQAFLDGVREAAGRFNVEVLAYCLLKREYHLLVKTPEGNLSRFMRQVDGLYTQYFQRSSRKRGSVFRARYKSVLFQAESYLLPLSRYLHGLPRQSRQNPLQWPWTSLHDYLDPASTGLPAAGLVDPREVLARTGLINGSDGAARAHYERYMQEAPDSELVRFYGKKNLQSVLGDKAFVSRVRAIAATEQVRGASKGEQASRRPSSDVIINTVATSFNVTDNSILNAARGPGSKNVPRWVAMYLCQEAGGITLQNIARDFGLQRYGTVSTTIGKLKDEFVDNPPLVHRVERLRQALYQ